MTTGIDPVLLDVLACPDTHHAPVRSGQDAAGAPVLVCTECGRAFPIRDGIPVMLLDEAIPPPGVPIEPDGAGGSA